MTETATTLGQLNPGDEILSITSTQGVIPASVVTTGILFPTDGTVQRLFVRSAKVFGKSAIVTFTNGGFLPACAAKTPCTIAV